MGQGGAKNGQQCFQYKLSKNMHTFFTLKKITDKHSTFSMILVLFEKYFLMKKEQVYGCPFNAPLFL